MIYYDIVTDEKVLNTNVEEIKARHILAACLEHGVAARLINKKESLTYEEWVEKYKPTTESPVTPPLHLIDDICIWTIIYDGMHFYATSGYYPDRAEGYFITLIPHNNEQVTVLDNS